MNPKKGLNPLVESDYKTFGLIGPAAKGTSMTIMFLTSSTIRPAPNPAGYGMRRS